ncbi:phage tail protein [Enterobacter sp. Bisph1]|uniref:phage tail protein n=1 Tax=Enterobacter sp. Bisph1 TaxID=1274399 RepID=UPI00057C33C8|nr:phage tail protein [Enterobacter sp. Bisph1]
MTAKFFAILTNQGAAKLANAASLGTKLNLSQMAIGDANGALPTPDPAQTKLINQKRIAPLNRLSVDPNNTNQIIAEQVIPENEGGYWIREIGLYDDENVLIAVANCPETYKPQLQEGSGRTQTIRMVVVVSSTAAVTLKIDPSVVLATRQYADDLMSNHVKASNPHAQYAPLASPVFIGMPTVPDTHIGNAGQQIANTRFVHDVINDDNTILPVGVPVPWPQAAAPGGWFKCNGAAFDKARYPRLATAYPAGVLPDLRGEFIRGLDDGRGLDIGRALLSAQADEFRSHNHRFINEYHTPTIRIVGATDENSEGVEANQVAGVRAWTYIWMEETGGVETRPHNIAFNYIVRAQ